MKVYDKKLGKIVLISLLVVTAIAILDILSMASGSLGTPQQYTLGDFAIKNWWNLFFSFTIVIIILSSVVYYILKKDLSESIAIALCSFSLYMFGVADILYFWLRGLSVPNALPWLSGNPYISTVSNLFGFCSVTNIALFFSAIIGIIWVYIIAFILERYF